MPTRVPRGFGESAEVSRNGNCVFAPKKAAIGKLKQNSDVYRQSAGIDLILQLW